MASVDGFRLHAVIDGDADDEELQLYLNAAMGYLNRSEVPCPGASEVEKYPLEAGLYDMAVYQIATHYYERRGMVGDGVAAEVFGVQGIIHQLAGFFKGS